MKVVRWVGKRKTKRDGETYERGDGGVLGRGALFFFFFEFEKGSTCQIIPRGTKTKVSCFARDSLRLDSQALINSARASSTPHVGLIGLAPARTELSLGLISDFWGGLHTFCVELRFYKVFLRPRSIRADNPCHPTQC